MLLFHFIVILQHSDKVHYTQDAAPTDTVIRCDNGKRFYFQSGTATSCFYINSTNEFALNSNATFWSQLTVNGTTIFLI